MRGRLGRRALGAVPLLGAIGALLLPAAGAQAAKAFPTTGPGLEPIGCVKDPATDATCDQTSPGIKDIEGFGESPGGETLYAGGFESKAVAWLGRGANGALSPGSCIDDGSTGACPASYGPVGGPASVAVAGDSAYTAGFSTGGLVRFGRGGDGSLAPVNCFSGSIGSCTAIPGMVEPNDVVVSPDGGSLYLSDQIASAVYRFNRAPDGTLSYVNCVSDSAIGEPSCGQQVEGLGNVFGLDISADGQSLYAIGSQRDTVVTFNRAPDGSLAFAGCIVNSGSGENCAQTTNGMSLPFEVAVSPDGGSVYTVSFLSESVAVFNRASDGSLTPAGCVAGTKGDSSCVQSGFSLKGAWSIDVSGDSASVYATAQTGDVLVSFLRAPDGSLTPAGCVLATDTDKGFPDRSAGTAGAKTKSGACAILAHGMEDPRAVYASNDGNNVYVGSDQHAAVAFRRDIQPPTTKVKGPKTTSSHKPKLKLKSDEPGTFLCAVNKGAPKPCGAKYKPKLGGGKNTVFVAAVDAAGNPDPTPAKRKITVND